MKKPTRKRAPGGGRKRRHPIGSQQVSVVLRPDQVEWIDQTGATRQDAISNAVDRAMRPGSDVALHCARSLANAVSRYGFPDGTEAGDTIDDALQVFRVADK